MRLVGGIAGAVIGAYFGNPYAGYAIGSMIGGVLEGPQKVKQEGPRLTDLKVTNSNYGIGKPKLFGTYRMSGNLIFSTSLKETKTVDRQEQGKGGPQQVTETTTYTYRATCAYALCEGVINGVRRIWFEGKLVYDYSQNNTGFIGNIGGVIKVYNGTETQLPDPSLEAELGIGEVPAYRGTAYVVFTDMQLQEFGNRIPNFTFEVIRSPENVNTGKYDSFTSDLLTTDTFGFFVYNPINRFVYANLTSSGTFSLTNLYKIDPFNNEIVLKNETGFFNLSFANMVLSKKINFLSNGDLVLGNQKTTSQNGTAWLIVDQDTLQIKRIINYRDFQDLGWNGYTGESFRAPPNLKMFKDTFYTYYVSASDNSSSGFQFFMFTDFGENIFQPVQFNLPNSNPSSIGTSVKSSLNFGNLFEVDGVNKNLYWTLTTTNYQSTGNRAIVLSKFDFVNNILIDNFKVLVTSNTDNFEVKQIFFDKLTRNLIIGYVNLTTNRTFILKYNIDTETVISNIVMFDGVNYPNVSGIHFDFNMDTVFRRVYFNYNVGSDRYIMYYKVDTDEISSLKYSENNPNWGLNSIGNCNSAFVEELGCEIYINRSANATRTILKNFGPRLTMGTYPLDLCIQELIKDSGLNLNMVDTTELSGDIIYGFVIPNSSSIRSCLEQLAIAYNFEMVESDFKLKFRKNGGNPIKTIKFSELSAVNYAPDIKFETDLTTERIQELELPRIVNLTYADIERDYQNNTQESKIENVFTNEIQNVELPMVFNANQARQISERLLYQTWINRDTYTFSTNYNHIDLEPCDVIQVVKDDGSASFTMKIQKKEKGGGIIKFSAIAEDSAVFTQIINGESGSNISQIIPVISTSRLFWLDIPILQNTDNDPGVYVATSKQNNNLVWTGSSLYVSDQENGNYIEQTSFFNEVTNGNTTQTLGDFSIAFQNGEYLNITDTVNSVIVKLNDGTLSSITDEQLLNGYNLCLIGDEVLQFQNANLIDTNTYLLDTFLRGRFGTEQNISTHNQGDRFVLLNASSRTIQRILKDSSQLKIPRFVKNVSFKENIFNTYPLVKVNNGVGLKPYSVNNIKGIRQSNGNLNVNFNKRVRGFTQLQDGIDVFDPDGDFYEVDIYTNNSFTEIKRTLFINSTNFVYSSQEQIADFGSNQSSINFKIYKINSIIGRGYEAKATV